MAFSAFSGRREIAWSGELGAESLKADALRAIFYMSYVENHRRRKSLEKKSSANC